MATALAAAVGLLTGPVVAIPASVSVLAGMIYAYVSRSRAEASELKAPEYADLGALVTILEPQVRYGAELLESLRTMQ